MDAWMLDFALLVLAVMMMGVAIYKLLFSAEEEARREQELRPKPGFERRSAERVDRRRDWRGPPAGIERRQSIRR